MPARWGYGLGGATIDIGRVPLTTDDPIWNHMASTWIADASLLTSLALAMIVLAATLLGRLDPLRGR